MAITLKFVNQDAVPKTQEIRLANKAGIAPIMDWYGAFHAGDNYRTYIDGKRVAMGINGELKHS